MMLDSMPPGQPPSSESIADTSKPATLNERLVPDTSEFAPIHLVNADSLYISSSVSQSNALLEDLDEFINAHDNVNSFSNPNDFDSSMLKVNKHLQDELKAITTIIETDDEVKGTIFDREV